MSFTLYDYQHDLINQAREKFQSNRGVLIQSPPGSGKSIMIAEVIKQATTKPNAFILFVVHRKELVEQITDTLTRHSVPHSRVLVTTVIKARNRLSELTKPTLIVTDESHHSRASTYKQIYDYFDDVPLLGFTATPWRMNGKGFTDIYGEAVYGKTVQWLIDNNRLAPFEYKSINKTDSDKLKRSSTGDYTKQSIDDALGKTIFGDVIEHYQKFAKDKKAILYAHSVERSKELAKKFTESGITAEHIDSKTPKLERERTLNSFREGAIQVLCNVDLISEGFDVPDCECVILLRPTTSLVLFLQQSMRCMRYQPNKQAIILDHVGNCHTFGLPTREYDWIKHFNGTYTKSKKKANSLHIRECEQCFSVFKPNTRTCPNCGHTQEINFSDLQEVDAHLSDFVDFRVDHLLAEYSNKDKSELKTLEDYYLYAVAKDMKLNWIKFQLPELKRMEWWQFNQKIAPLKQKYNY